MSDKLHVGLVQMTSGEDVSANLRMATRMIDEATSAGAHFILTPEMTNILTSSGRTLHAACVTEDEDTTLAALRAKATDLGIWLLIGSLAIKTGEGRLANRSFLIAPDGHVVARYDKLHMFDVELPGGEHYRESKSYEAGTRAVAARMPSCLLGMSICYDLRFPYLYRKLAHAGATVMAVPSAFTKTTGQAHWHTLLQARAIETGSFVLAPAQTGYHCKGRETYGHSLIVGPWGEVIKDGQEEPGVLTATLNLAEVEEARRKIPSLSHDVSLGEVETYGDD